MKRLMAALIAGALFATTASAHAKVLGNLDDARACAPLASGGLAVGTGAGLVLVDARGAAKVLTSRDGLPGTRVLAVHEHAGALWAGTEGGAARVEGGRVVATVPLAAVSALATTSRGLVAGTWGKGLVVLGEGRIAPVPWAPGETAASRVTSIAEHAGVVHVAFADGPVATLSGGALRASSAGTRFVHALATVPDGKGGVSLAMGGLEGLFRGTRSGVVANADVRALAPAKDGVFVGTWGTGLRTWDVVTGALAPAAGLPEDAREVQAVGVRDAVTCVATTRGTFVSRAGGAFSRVVVPSALPSNDVTALAPNGAEVLVGTFDRGAVILATGKDGAPARRVPGTTAADSVNAVAWQGSRAWVATAAGLVRAEADGTTRRFTSHDGLPSNVVRALLVDGASVVVGTDAGPVRIDGDVVTRLAPEKGKGRVTPLASPNHATWALAKDRSGALVVGTTTGLYVGRRAASGAFTFTRHSVSSGVLEDDWITALAIDDDGSVLVGTYAHGVVRLAGSLDAPAPTRLGGGYVNAGGLRVAGGKVFAATMDGLLVRDAGSKVAWEVVRDAAPGRDVTAIAEVGGERWIATRRGIGVVPARWLSPPTRRATRSRPRATPTPP